MKHNMEEITPYIFQLEGLITVFRLLQCSENLDDDMQNLFALFASQLEEIKRGIEDGVDQIIFAEDEEK